MTDTVPTEELEPVALVAPAPAAVEVETAPPHAISPEAAEPVAAAPAAKVDEAAPEADVPAAAPEIAFQNGSTSELVVDHFIDSEGDQSMNAIKAALPHIDPNTIESAVRRLWEKGRLLRVAPGVYRLAPEKPPGLSKSPPPAPEDEAMWFAAFDAW